MIFFLIFVLILSFVLQKKMGVWALDKLTCSIRSENYLVEPDEAFTLVFTVENHSRLPVLYLGCRCSVPMGAELCGGVKGKITTLFHTAEYRFNCFMMPHQSVEHKFQLRLPQRGGYMFADLHLMAGDFFGLKETEKVVPGSCEVVVLPKKPDKKACQEVLGGLMGERCVMRWIHEDPILSSGFREYTGREPLKSVSWNRSLQSGRLMVRNMDHTAEEKITVLLTMEEGKMEEMEQCLSMCRGIVETLEGQKLPFAFMHNGMLRTAVGILPTIESGLGRQHLNLILEALGRAEFGARESLNALVGKALLRSQDSTCYILIAPTVTHAVRQAAARLGSGSGSTVQIIDGGAAR